MASLASRAREITGNRQQGKPVIRNGNRNCQAPKISLEEIGLTSTITQVNTEYNRNVAQIKPKYSAPPQSGSMKRSYSFQPQDRRRNPQQQDGYPAGFDQLSHSHRGSMMRSGSCTSTSECDYTPASQNFDHPMNQNEMNQRAGYGRPMLHSQRRHEERLQRGRVRYQDDDSMSECSMSESNASSRSQSCYSDYTSASEFSSQGKNRFEEREESEFRGRVRRSHATRGRNQQQPRPQLQQSRGPPHLFYGEVDNSGFWESMVDEYDANGGRTGRNAVPNGQQRASFADDLENGNDMGNVNAQLDLKNRNDARRIPNRSIFGEQDYFEDKNEQGNTMQQQVEQMDMEQKMPLRYFATAAGQRTNVETNLTANNAISGNVAITNTSDNKDFPRPMKKRIARGGGQPKQPSSTGKHIFGNQYDIDSNRGDSNRDDDIESNRSDLSSTNAYNRENNIRDIEIRPMEADWRAPAWHSGRVGQRGKKCHTADGHTTLGEAIGESAQKNDSMKSRKSMPISRKWLESSNIESNLNQEEIFNKEITGSGHLKGRPIDPNFMYPVLTTSVPGGRDSKFRSRKARGGPKINPHLTQGHRLWDNKDYARLSGQGRMLSAPSSKSGGMMKNLNDNMGTTASPHNMLTSDMDFIMGGARPEGIHRKGMITYKNDRSDNVFGGSMKSFNKSGEVETKAGNIQSASALSRGNMMIIDAIPQKKSLRRSDTEFEATFQKITGGGEEREINYHHGRNNGGNGNHRESRVRTQDLMSFRGDVDTAQQTPLLPDARTNVIPKVTVLGRGQMSMEIDGISRRKKNYAAPQDLVVSHPLDVDRQSRKGKASLNLGKHQQGTSAESGDYAGKSSYSLGITNSQQNQYFAKRIFGGER